MANWYQRWTANRKENREKRTAQEASAREAQQKEREWYWIEWEKIRAISINEAVSRVLQESENGKIILTRERASDMEILNLLPETAHNFFAEVSEVYIDPTMWGIYRKDFEIESFPGYVFIGDPDEGDPIAIKYYEDGVYHPYSVDGRLNLERPYGPSIFHEILISLLSRQEYRETR